MGEFCHCLCQRWDHLGVCTGGDATIVSMRWADGEVPVPMCAACADDVIPKLAGSASR